MLEQRDHRNRPSFDSLESRTLCAAVPAISNLHILNESGLAPGRQMTIVVDADAQAGVRAVSFFIDRDANGRWTEGVDRHLGEVSVPDSGTAHQFSLTRQLDWSFESFPLIAANAVDLTGQWGSATARRVTIYSPPVITQLVAESISSTQVQLTARVTAPFGVASGALRGVTFFYDANGNGGWDMGIDTDLGYTEIRGGFQQREFTLLATVDPTWPSTAHFAAAARNMRPDQFGIPSVTTVRPQSGSVPRVLNSYILPQGYPNPDQLFAGYSATISVLWNTPGVTALTLFRDVNHNGMWDYTIDQHIQDWSYSGPSSGQEMSITLDKTWGSGLISLGLAIRTDPALGDNAWSPVQSMFYVQRFEAWIEPPAQTSFNVLRNDTLTFDVRARDEVSVRGVFAFIDMDNDHRRSPFNDIYLSDPIRLSYASAPWVRYRVSLTADLPAGTYQIGLAAVDFTRHSGPITWISVTIN